ncbi:MAG: hypothetical protein GTO02_13610 [Candidatus Dadabacteria bacterium]|nr:hypothetical protein [Candidatus Dadabacteria bacterium]
MERDEAIDYLERKKKLEDPYTMEERRFNKEEEAEIKKVMERGEIYGDPLVIIE